MFDIPKRLFEIVDMYGHVKLFVFEELLPEQLSKQNLLQLLETNIKEGKLKCDIVCKLHHNTPCYSRKF